MAMMNMNIKQTEMEQNTGLCLYLSSEQTKALGLDKLPEVGAEVPIKALAKVKRTMVEDDGEGKEHYLTLEIMQMEVGKFSGGMKEAGSLLYGASESYD
jgi:hypothetical protein